MGPKSKKRQSSHYDSDNGFVANDSGNEGNHRAKKARTTKSKNTASAAQPSKTTTAKASKSGDGGSKVDANGDQYWELSRLRRVTVSSFKGRTLVNVREYYEKDGQELPGKKGISMPIDQFSSMVKLLPSIEAALEQKGESLPRPEYGASSEKKSEEPDEEEEEEDQEDDVEEDEDQLEDASEEEEEEVKPRSKKEKRSKKNTERRKNIEATSDEDE